MGKVDVLLLTESRYENPDHSDKYIQNVLLEDEILIRSLNQIGLNAERVDWCRKDYDWASVSIILIRSTWDYHDKWDEFLSFLEVNKSKVKFVNTVDTLIWSMDKHYLQDLQEKGVAIVDSFFIEKGTTISLKEVWNNFNTKEIILKPCISAGARHTYRINKDALDGHESIFNELVSRESMIVQEFQKNIVEKGEVSLMFFNGKFSHAILKKAKEGDFRVQDDFGGSVHDYHASNQEIQFGMHILEHVDPMPIYARVDICEDNHSELALVELELIEPELWFRNSPDSADLLAGAIAALLK